eukprot:TRINITY_DN7499_c0_g1_i2.p1 TRINITY_DN7499_c0_g1~~TRINITY_DN7499_c0_g1_i2.p1  ORF type:complete len:179 (-),score=60.61 TRINITY_DN7499_c0_g1_i2:356-892(-)
MLALLLALALVGSHASDGISLDGGMREVSVRTLLGEDAPLADLDAIKDLYHSAQAEQHAKDQALLDSLSASPTKHRCWCSRMALKPQAELQEEAEHARVLAERTQAQQEAEQAHMELARAEQVKDQVAREQHEARLGGGGCEACTRQKTALEIELREAQMQAQQLAGRVKRLRKDLEL